MATTNLRFVSWKEFDLCIKKIAFSSNKKSFNGVYGFPRGGLCLAVALSHYLDIKLLETPQNGSLIVDDVYETGKTLNKVRDLKDSKVFVWFSKVRPQWWEAVQIVEPREWLVFPWENPTLAINDKRNYECSRFRLNE